MKKILLSTLILIISICPLSVQESAYANDTIQDNGLISSQYYIIENAQQSESTISTNKIVPARHHSRSHHIYYHGHHTRSSNCYYFSGSKKIGCEVKNFIMDTLFTFFIYGLCIVIVGIIVFIVEVAKPRKKTKKPVHKKNNENTHKDSNRSE